MNITDTIISFIVPGMHSMYILLGIMFVYSLIWLHNKNKDTSSVIDLSDLVIDETSKKLSSSKLIRLGTWVITSWAFIFIVIQGQLQEWYAISYMGIWTGNALLRNYFQKKDNNNDTI